MKIFKVIKRIIAVLALLAPAYGYASEGSEGLYAVAYLIAVFVKYLPYISITVCFIQILVFLFGKKWRFLVYAFICLIVALISFGFNRHRANRTDERPLRDQRAIVSIPDKAAAFVATRKLTVRSRAADVASFYTIIPILQSSPLIPEVDEVCEYIDSPRCVAQLSARKDALREIETFEVGLIKKTQSAPNINYLARIEKKYFPSSLRRKEVDYLHKAAIEMFKEKDLLTAVAIWLNAAAQVNGREQAIYHSWAGRALTRAGDIVNGPSLAAQADKIAPTDRDVAYTAVITLLHSAHFTEALKRIEKAESDGFKDELFLYVHTLILEQLGRPWDARQVYHRMKNDPFGDSIGFVPPPNYNVWTGINGSRPIGPKLNELYF